MDRKPAEKTPRLAFLLYDAVAELGACSSLDLAESEAELYAPWTCSDDHNVKLHEPAPLALT
jgi:hypothetical protein